MAKDKSKDWKNLKKFKFKGVDGDNVPIITGNNSQPIPPQDEGGPGGDPSMTIEVFYENPTWVKIGGRWYRIG